MQAESLKSTIRGLASRHGFDLCHFSKPKISGAHRDALDCWVAEGMQGDMTWMGEPMRLERRKAPETMLDGVRSVISVGMRYSPPAYALNEAENADDRGVISCYAHGVDYHDVMKKRLKALASDLDDLLGRHDQRVYVDTAPVLEHALAEAGGLGWQGKHTLTINRQQGSWLLLGEIFTTAELQYDAPASNHCGSCTACIDICPTAAIVAPYVVDSRRCISYLTIEFDGYIDSELRPLMGNRIYGCDDCQQICPWNRHADAPEPDLLTPSGENLLPELASLLALDEAGFRERFRKSPIRRTKRRGLLRNVCIAMGNSGRTEFVHPLLTALNDAEALVRGHAAWALSQLVSPANRQQLSVALERALVSEQVEKVASEFRAAITRMEYDE